MYSRRTPLPQDIEDFDHFKVDTRFPLNLVNLIACIWDKRERCIGRSKLRVPEQVLDGLPLGLGVVMHEDEQQLKLI